MRKKGSITVEASLVLPWFLFAVMTIIYFIKVIYIHDQVQYAITESASNMAVHAYILEKAEILNTQQEIYLDLVEKSMENESNIDIIEDNLTEITKGIDNLTNFNLTYDNFGKEKNLSAKNISDLIFEIKGFRDYFRNVIDSTYYSFNSVFENIKIILEDSKFLLTKCEKEGIGFANSVIGEKIVQEYMKNQISEEDYKKWNIVNGKEGMNYKRSEFLLKDENIHIIVSYKIRIPFPIPKKIEIPMTQSVKVRAWTGSNNYIIQKNYDEEDTNNEIVYVTPTGKRYHKSTCTSVKVKIIEYTYEQVKNRELCKYCKKISTNKKYNKVYGTEKSNIFHVIKECPYINKKAIKIELEEAKKRGLTQCKNCYKGEK